MERHRPAIENAGLRVVAVAVGEPKHARRYCTQLAPSATCLCDADGAAHRDFGLKRGSILELAGPQVVSSAVRAARDGHSQGRATGDPTILSATFVVDRQGLIQYSTYSKFAGDHPDLAALLGAVRTRAVLT